MKLSLGALLQYSVAGWACTVHGQSNYCNLLPTATVYKDSRVHYYHCPIGELKETLPNVKQILESNSQGPQSSSSGPASVISSLQYLGGIYVRPTVCVFGKPPALSLLEAEGCFTERICLAN